MKLFFFDTETTGLNSDDQILQFWGIYWDFDWADFYEENRINQYINVTKEISPMAESIHGINKNKIQEFWYIDSYIDEILSYIKNADYIVWHNLDFDIKMVKQECNRIGKGFDWKNIKMFCTMQNSIDIVNLPWKKRPKLTELYRCLFNKDFDNAHDAMVDVKATKDCFIELIKKWYAMLDYKEDKITSESSLIDYKQHNLDKYLRKIIIPRLNRDMINNIHFAHNTDYWKIYIKLLRTKQWRKGEKDGVYYWMFQKTERDDLEWTENTVYWLIHFSDEKAFDKILWWEDVAAGGIIKMTNKYPAQDRIAWGMGFWNCRDCWNSIALYVNLYKDLDEYIVVMSDASYREKSK